MALYCSSALELLCDSEEGLDRVRQALGLGPEASAGTVQAEIRGTLARAFDVTTFTQSQEDYDRDVLFAKRLQEEYESRAELLIETELDTLDV